MQHEIHTCNILFIDEELADPHLEHLIFPSRKQILRYLGPTAATFSYFANYQHSSNKGDYSPFQNPLQILV